MAARKKARMRPARERKGRSASGSRLDKLEGSLAHLEKLLLEAEDKFSILKSSDGRCTVTVHKWQAVPDEPGAKIADAVEKKLSGHGLSLKDAAPPTMTTPTRRTVMERLAELETADELLDARHREFAFEAREALATLTAEMREQREWLNERLAKVEAALGEV